MANLATRGIATPVVALTAFALATDVKKAQVAGFAAHLSKPIDRASLVSVVSRLAQHKAR